MAPGGRIVRDRWQQCMPAAHTPALAWYGVTLPLLVCVALRLSIRQHTAARIHSQYSLAAAAHSACACAAAVPLLRRRSHAT